MGTGRARSSQWASQTCDKAPGFTLIELMLTLTVAAVLAVLAVPAFREFVANQRVRTASFDLMSMLTMARSEAIKRNSTATLGGIAAGSLQISSGGTVIQQREPFVNLTLTCKSGGAAVTCTDVVYGGNGRLQASVPAIEITSAATSRVTCVKIDPSGRPSSKQGPC